MIEVDARGYACPIPVVRTKKTIEQNPGKKISVLLDSSVSKENISRLAGHLGYQIMEEIQGEECRLILDPAR